VSTEPTVAMRVDHMLLAVQDLDAASRDFRERLGMNAQVGGVHPGRGTHNSLVHLGAAYLELISVNDRSAEKAQPFVRFLEQGDAPYTFALAVADLEAASEALRARGLTVPAPREGSRLTPEGVLLRWRATDLRPGPGGPGPDAPPLPFLIQWETDEAGRAWFDGRVRLAEHEAGWGDLHALFIATSDPEALGAEYERLFGWERLRGEPVVAFRMPGGDTVNPSLGRAPHVVLFQPAPNDAAEWRRVIGDAARARIDRHGAGVLGIAIHVRSVDEVVAALARRGVRTVLHPEGRWALIEPRDAHGMVVELVQGG
jgi:catechol 2,3-dioxygenase-like lactoylglutathione lyase family enzyme